MQFEEVITTLTAEIVDLPEAGVEEKIDKIMRVIGEYTDSDEMLLVRFPAAAGDPVISHSWFRDDKIRDFEFDFTQFLDHFQWTAERLRQGQFVKFGTLDVVPAEAVAERAYLDSKSIQAAVVIPRMDGTRLAGLMIVQRLREQPWPDYLVEELQLATLVFFGAFKRRAAERELQSALAEIAQLKEQLEIENALLQQDIKTLSEHVEIVGGSPALKEVISQAEQVAPLDSIVLIQGETGSGKELIANLIHRESARAGRKMVRVNCATLPASLIEAELFGREKGAYTGALSKQAGRFELADGSTLFLDEIAELPLELQPKLLRVLQEGEFERLGSTRTMKVDVRVIAATNRDLRELVEQGGFREDLYYRLNVFPIAIPPLRDRRGDIPALVWSFVNEFSDHMGKTIDGISKQTMKRLQQYDWPGNVRELRNMIERSMILSRGSRLEVELVKHDVERPCGQTLLELESRHIRSVLEQTNWRIRGEGGAAEILDLHPNTLHSRMKKLGIARSVALSGDR
ncbi:MAG: sigma 54-interacting transcriptional regulator [Gammaproteobacteria bacterium]|nr:sigma 54-interacting transcriptional regulator [Gammaproteobacteria bacterium]